MHHSMRCDLVLLHNSSKKETPFEVLWAAVAVGALRVRPAPTDRPTRDGLKLKFY